MVRLLKADHRRAPNYLSRRAQWRLLLLLVPLGLVIIAMGRLRDPQFANRVNQIFAQESDSGRQNAPAAKPTRSPEKPLSPGAFHSDGQDLQQASKEAAVTESKTVAPAVAGLFTGVEADRLRTISDNSYFRNGEKDAWFHFFGLMQHTSAEGLKTARAIDANYAQLVDQPNFYRGKLFNAYGFVRQITEQTPAPNDLGIKSYYRVVLQPADGSTWPIFVYCLELPAELKVGDDQAGGYAKVVGVFFKKLSYEWQGGLGTAPVIVAKSIDYYGVAPCGPPMTDIHPPVAAQAWDGADTATEAANTTNAQAPAEPTTSFRDVLTIAGWSVDRLAEFDDGQPLSEAQRIKALELLRRLRSFNSADLDAWVHDGLWPNDLLEHAADYRGQLVRLTGRATKVTPRKPEAADAQRLEMPEYFECDVVLEKEGGLATILTARIPRAWLQSNTLSEPVSAVALYLKKLGNDDRASALWLSKEIAWHPGQQPQDNQKLTGATIERQLGDTDGLTFGRVVLGNLGMDVGLLDQIQSRGTIRREEREAFYQMLNAAGRIGANQLARFAQQNLPAVREEWKTKLATAEAAASKSLAQEVLRRAAQGRHSVAALFNDADAQIGRLFVFDGTAKRVVRVEVVSEVDGGPSDVAQRFGIDHYYEMEVFTEDSQNHPLVFCVRELPDGFPTGDALHEPVRVAGFFFKDWLYHTRGAVQEGGKAGPDSPRGVEAARYAPLLIGRGPLLVTVEQGGSTWSRYVGVGLFVSGLFGIWAAAVVYARGDRRFRRETQAASFSLPAGKSLNDLNLATADLPANLAALNVPASEKTSQLQ